MTELGCTSPEAAEPRAYRTWGAPPVSGPAQCKAWQRHMYSTDTAGAQIDKDGKICPSQHGSHPNMSSTDCSSAPDYQDYSPLVEYTDTQAVHKSLAWLALHAQSTL